MFQFRVVRTFVAIMLATTLIGSAAAQSTVTVEPLRIVVNPTPQFSVTVRVDKDRTGHGTPVYFYDERLRAGDPIRLTVTVSEDAYVYLFNVTASGEVVQFFPNRYDGAANRVRAGQTLRVPPAAGGRYELSVAPPYGIDKVIAVASRRALDTSTLATFTTQFDPDKPASAFAASNLGQDGLAQALSIVVSPVPQTDWVTDTVQFQVRRR